MRRTSGAGSTRPPSVLWGGAAVYTGANWFLARQGAKHRKRSGQQQPLEAEDSGSGLAIALGALLDGIPESIVIGVSMIGGGAVSLVAVIAIFLSNIPEGLSCSAGMKKADRSAGYVFGIWATIAVISGVASVLGYVLFSRFSDDVIAATTGCSRGRDSGHADRHDDFPRHSSRPMILRA
jgi:zinc transporter, ZIP family